MNSEALTTNITHFMNARLAGESHFLVGVRVSADLRRVTVLLDGDNGVDVDFCARMSREIGEQLEGLEEVPAYVLEVSSPGADAPMKLFRQYPKHIVICVPTPLNKNREPDISYILKTGEAIAPYLKTDRGRQEVEGGMRKKLEALS